MIRAALCFTDLRAHALREDGSSTTVKGRVQHWPTIVNRYFLLFKPSSDKDIYSGIDDGKRILRDFSGINGSLFQSLHSVKTS
jgi:hypothetical protein